MNKDKNQPQKGLKSLEESYFVALSLKVEKAQQKEFKQEIKENLNIALKELKQKGAIKEISVYSHKKAAEKHGDFPLWDYIVLIQLKDKQTEADLLPKLRTLKLSFVPEIVRIELLVTTPNSTYPIPGEGAKKRRIKPFYAVEYVDVKKNYLDEFRQIMVEKNGPAMRYIMEQAKWCYNFYALETVEVYYHNPQYPTWNQVHVIGLYPEAVIRYKRDFSMGLKLAKQISFIENFARLKEIRIMRYKSIGGKLTINRYLGDSSHNITPK